MLLAIFKIFAAKVNFDESLEYIFAHQAFNDSLDMHKKILNNYQESIFKPTDFDIKQQHLEISKDEQLILQNGAIGLNENTQVQINQNANGVNFRLKY